jgi:hypothetical protein
MLDNRTDPIIVVTDLEARCRHDHVSVAVYPDIL